MERQMNTTTTTNTTVMTSSSPSSSPTTFVHVDTNTFRDLVQKLTGFAGDSEKAPVGLSSTSSSTPSHHHPIEHHATGPRRSPFKLQERRQHTMRKLEIKLGLTSSLKPFSGPHHRTLHRVNKSPVASPVTPLGSEWLSFPSPGTESPSSSPAVLEEEEKAISEKGFYLHPSPLNTPRGSEPPELLNLFPLSSAPSHQRFDD